jgi:hypothetical protein
VNPEDVKWLDEKMGAFFEENKVSSIEKDVEGLNI